MGGGEIDGTTSINHEFDAVGRMGTVEMCMAVEERFKYHDGELSDEALQQVLARVDALDRSRGKRAPAGEENAANLGRPTGEAE